MQNFSYWVPTEFVFGKNAEEKVGEKLKANGYSRVFIVIGGTEVKGEVRLLLVNGSLRPAETPKQKNLIHVKPIGRLDENDLKALAKADNNAVMAMVEKFDICRE